MKIEGSEMEYPVGTRFMQNLPIIESMSSNILSFIKQTYRKRYAVVIFCRGSSGSFLSAIISKDLMKAGYKVYIYHIKKEDESSHDFSTISPHVFDKQNITMIIDDFIATGNTIRSIIKYIKHDTGLKKINVNLLCVSGHVDGDIELRTDAIYDYLLTSK